MACSRVVICLFVVVCAFLASSVQADCRATQYTLPQALPDFPEAEVFVKYVVELPGERSSNTAFSAKVGAFKDGWVNALAASGFTITCDQIYIGQATFLLVDATQVEVYIHGSNTEQSVNLIKNAATASLNSVGVVSNRLTAALKAIDATMFPYTKDIYLSGSVTSQSVIYSASIREDCKYTAWTNCQTCSSVTNQASSRMVLAQPRFGGEECGATLRTIVCPYYCPEDDSLSGGAIAGIVIGCVVGAFLIIFLLYWCCVRNKETKEEKQAAPAPQKKEEPEPSPEEDIAPNNVTVDVSDPMPEDDIKADSENVVRVFL